MPSGYTEILHDEKNVDFATFVLRCARGLMVCAHQRDESLDALPSPREVSSYYYTALKQAEESVAELEALTPEQAEVKAEEAYQRAIEDRERRKNRNSALQARYEAMLDQVQAWEPPTPDHQSLQKFMTQQIQEALQFDCGVDMDPIPPNVLRSIYPDEERKSGAEWLSNKLERARTHLANMQRNLAEEEDRAAKSNRWIAALYDNLGRTPSGIQ
jgi:hypothetical protein